MYKIKNGRMIALITLLFVAILMVLGSSEPFSYATNTTDEKYEITSLQELENTLDKAGTLTKSEGRDIVEKTEPKVLDEYVENVMEEEKLAVEKVTPSIKYDESEDITTEVYESKIDKNTNATLTVIDRPEQTLMASISKKVENALFAAVYAATNGEAKWKSYGNRYYTARYKCSSFAGAYTFTFESENHYNVSSTGITERLPGKGDKWATIVASFGYGEIKSKSFAYKMLQKTAIKKDASAAVKVNATIERYDPRVPTTSIGTFSHKLSIKLLEFDKKGKRVKVKHSWKQL